MADNTYKFITCYMRNDDRYRLNEREKEEFYQEIDLAKKEGWKLAGGISVLPREDRYILFQAMEKDETPKEKPIREITILRAENLDVLAEKITEALKQGWELEGVPYGIDDPIVFLYCQTMVKY